MRIPKKLAFALVIISCTLAVASIVLMFLHYLTLNYVILILGITQLIGGLNQINIVKNPDLDRTARLSPNTGKFSVVLGGILIVIGILSIVFIQ